MMEDFSVLVGELERCFGEQRVLPPRSELREMNRCAGGRAGTDGPAWGACMQVPRTASLPVLPSHHLSTSVPACRCCRSDLEKAISAHGGPSQVAAQLGWKQRAKGRRPKGYWDSLDNVRAELDEFIDEAGLPPGVSAGGRSRGAAPCPG